MTDYIPQYALYIKKNYPKMVPTFETSDETWNRAVDNGVFAKIRTSYYHSLDRAWPADDSGDEWAGKVASTMCQTVSAIYNGDPAKYRCIVGVWTNGEWHDPAQANPRSFRTPMSAKTRHLFLSKQAVQGQERSKYLALFHFNKPLRLTG